MTKLEAAKMLLRHKIDEDLQSIIEKKEYDKELIYELVESHLNWVKRHKK